MKSYSQYGEDLIVQALFGDHVGRLLEIGAWHPTDKSNSALLVEAGWSAVLIEPSPLPVSLLVKHYEGNPKVDIIQAAVALQWGLVRMAFTDDAVSTSDPNVAEVWAAHGGYYGFAWVPAITLADIWLQFGGFEFVSIDTEGSSVSLAQAYLATDALPKAMCIEHDGRIVELMEIAQARGYKAVHMNGTNVVIARG